MRTTAGDNYLFVNFERPLSSSMWLVVDDLVDSVRQMVLGFSDPLHIEEDKPGIGEESLHVKMIQAYCQNRRIRGTDVKGLLYFLGLAASFDDIGAVAFVNFDVCKDEVRRFVESQQALAVGAILDVYQTHGTPGKANRFETGWALADSLDIPHHFRVVLTIGGHDESVPEWIMKLPTIKKNFDQTEDFFFETVRVWWREASSPISGSAFQKLTNDSSAHHPSELPQASHDERRHIIDKLQQLDKYGVWKWCGELACHEIGRDAQLRWLAAKAFQTQPATSNKIPVTGLIALLHGSSRAPGENTPVFAVEDSLDTVSDLNKLGALGYVQLKSNQTYDEYAKALHAWLTHMEQKEAGNARIVKVTLAEKRDRRRIVLQLEYSMVLPEKMRKLIQDPPQETERRGRVLRAWEALLKFCTNNPPRVESGKRVCVELAWNPPPE